MIPFFQLDKIKDVIIDRRRPTRFIGDEVARYSPIFDTIKVSSGVLPDIYPQSISTFEGNLWVWTILPGYYWIVAKERQAPFAPVFYKIHLRAHELYHLTGEERWSESFSHEGTEFKSIQLKTTKIEDALMDIVKNMSLQFIEDVRNQAIVDNNPKHYTFNGSTPEAQFLKNAKTIFQMNGIIVGEADILLTGLSPQRNSLSVGSFHDNNFSGDYRWSEQYGIQELYPVEKNYYQLSPFTWQSWKSEHPHQTTDQGIVEKLWFANIGRANQYLYYKPKNSIVSVSSSFGRYVVDFPAFLLYPQIEVEQVFPNSENVFDDKTVDLWHDFTHADKYDGQLAGTKMAKYALLDSQFYPKEMGMELDRVLELIRTSSLKQFFWD